MYLILTRLVFFTIVAGLCACGGGGGNIQNVTPIFSNSTTTRLIPPWTKLSVQNYTPNLSRIVVAPNNSSIIYTLGNIVSYSGNSGWLYRSTDSGLSWTIVAPNINWGYDVAIDKDNQQIIYLATDKAILKSINGGDSWNNMATGSPIVGNVYSVVISPTNNQNLFAGIAGGGVIKSVDGGISWVLSSNGLHYSSQYLKYDSVFSIAIDRNNAQIMYVATDSGAYKSTNGGVTWTSISNGIASTDILVQKIYVDPSNSNIVYAVCSIWTSPGAIYRSSNGGNNWTLISRGLPAGQISDIGIDCTNGQELYTLVGSSIYKSTNSGTTWKTTSDMSLNTPFAVNSLAVDPNVSQVLYAAVGTTNGLIYKSTTGGF